MDLSPLIFVALAVAWAVYLIPQALKHHDEVVRSRSVDRFSERMRVLARREPVDRRRARLVLTPRRPADRPAVETKARRTPAPAPAAPVRPEVTRAAARRAARRRRNVLALVLLGNAVVVGLALASVVTWPWTAVPAGVLVAWLVACRLSVKAERRRRGGVPSAAIEVGRPPADLPGTDLPDTELTGEIAPVVVPPARTPAAEAPAVLSGEIPVVRESVPGAWDMVPTTLPTYVSKPAAQRRTVRTIDLDSTGVWSSGRNDDDSALAREAERAEAAEKDAEQVPERRASGA